ncbi:MAG: LysM peptidoglycan-binding domain-containing protein [Proteobacteria bacterium]|nr:LysM peptidoglycan-binding domain-containing protein [Pseudomonadota bacterium]
MSRMMICVTLMILLIGCAGRPIPQLSGASGQKLAGNAAPAPAVNVGNPSSPEQRLPRAEERVLEKASVPPEKVELSKPEQNLIPAAETSLEKAPALSKKSELSKSSSTVDQPKPPLHEGLRENEEEAERDIMEEAVVLLNESNTYWVSGNLEDALEMLDQAYALLLDTNGNPDIARQKDDLRLIISKRILAIYNSIPAVAKGKRSEIPVITNADVEKEIRQFQTVERDFFISSYQRSKMYRPIILRELKKAGLPEELSWLPLVESGFKINALSTARALGLWQFIPSTGYKYGLNRDDWFDERMDIEKSTRAAIDYLKELHTMFGDWLTVLAAYNCGEGRVIRTIASQHVNYLDRFWDLYQKLPYETARYVPRFLATLAVIRDPQKYGIDLGTGAGKISALSYEIAEINKSMRLQDIARKLDISEEVLNILNAELRHRITPDKPYKLKVPLEMAEQLLKVIDEIPQAEAPRASFFAKRGAVIRHKVRRGETLTSIASKYKTSVGAITAYNHLSKKQLLVAGRRLNVPIRTSKMAGPTGKTNKPEKIGRHKVQKGDTLTSLARKYDTTVAEIRRFNHLKKDALKIGQILRFEGDDNEGDKGQKRNSGEESKGKGKTVVKSKSGKGTETKTVKKYTVRKGDSLNKIARKNNMSLDKLLDINRLARKDNIYPGQVIMIQ